MSTSHTPGRLYVVESQEHWVPVNCHLTSEVDKESIGSIWGNGTSQNRADARRLVACWNACDGIPTETLEKYYGDQGGIDAAIEEASMRDHVEAVKQRDELLQALRSLHAAMACYDSTPEETLALEHARAAIAKATGAAS